MPGLTVEDETEALLGALERDELGDGMIRANAMMAAAVSYLARVAGPALVAAQLRADADTVAAHAGALGAALTPAPVLH